MRTYVTNLCCNRGLCLWAHPFIPPEPERHDVSACFLTSSCCCCCLVVVRGWGGSAVVSGGPGWGKPAEGWGGGGGGGGGETGGCKDVRTPCKPPICTSWNICRKGTSHLQGVQQRADTTERSCLHRTHHLGETGAPLRPCSGGRRAHRRV